MAYPTGVAFKQTVAPIGSQPIHEASTTKAHELGTIIRASDSTYGEGEFVYLAGVASTAQGDLVVYNSKTGATVRSVAGTTRGPAGVAMSNCDASTKYGWYQISGATPIKAATAAADAAVFLTSTAGQVDDLEDSGDLVRGALFRAATSSSYATVQLARPSVGGDAAGAGTLTCTLSAAVEAAQAIVVTGQVVTLNGDAVAAATEVVVRSLAVTDNKGDITVTTGTSNKVVNPATGENVAWITTDATGAFVVSIANDAAEITLVTAVADNGLVQALKLTFT